MVFSIMAIASATSPLWSSACSHRAFALKTSRSSASARRQLSRALS